MGSQVTGVMEVGGRVGGQVLHVFLHTNLGERAEDTVLYGQSGEDGLGGQVVHRAWRWNHTAKGQGPSSGMLPRD